MAEEIEEDITATDEPPELSLTGVLAGQLYVISTSRLSLVTTFAQSREIGPVLLPLADWQILGHSAGEEPNNEVTFEGVLPLDNIAFLLRDMSGEFREAVENLEALTSGASNLPHMDTSRMRDWLRDVADQAQAAINCLERMENAKE